MLTLRSELLFEATAKYKCLFFLDVGCDASWQPVKHSVPHGKLVAYKSYI